MQSAAQAYGTVARKTGSPRELEAALLLRAASRLQALHDHWDERRPDGGELEAALRFNRKLWTVFVSSAARPDHPLPAAIRQNVANIGLFVLSHTLAIQAAPRREALRSLININRQIAAGLAAPARSILNRQTG
ncbi:flagellar biosynthesis regulator FlaF [Blastochloris tepida]|jgi:flagellar protein FlaF|uniref:Flagellar biosynthesis regulatory protein FlaF n=1 Tax=Blastochloris tepida TaxID=2233851 RepID=A0A348FX01_9HYPH|nr:flagellar biosynthesis regulator FlaF [Blastochloris tepida]BBF91834.1 flagellar biosynthesis regulatory protein FlaF [Blastochloris tepida]